MIDWIDVNKELPKKNDNEIICYCEHTNSDLIARIRNCVFLKFITSSRFLAIEPHGLAEHYDSEDNFVYNGYQLTHWSFINKPEED